MLGMTKLQRWMHQHNKVDAEVAKAVKCSRPHISRVRRGVYGASPATAKRLEALTGIKWWHFVVQP
jgi:transcriptional regulator with XRE-family HTH domain